MLFVIFVLVLIIGALSSLAVTTVRSSFPQVDGTLSLPGLHGRVQVIRNASGVADIYADNAEDLFVAEGYVHAQDRFWEMDFRRHITAGRLSELFGPSQLKTDEVIRTMGWRRVAERELSLLSPTTRRYLEAYASGVNAYLRSESASDLSLEYNILGLTGLQYEPEPWSAVDSISWLKAMAWDLSSNKNDEIERALLSKDFSSSQIAELFPAYDTDTYQPIVTSGSVKGGSFEPTATNGSARPPVSGVGSPAGVAALRKAAKSLDAIPELVGGGGADAGVGSNSWVVSGSRTTTGKAMLSNDPHLALSVPSIFEQVGLHCRTVDQSCPFDVSGYSFSGMPGVIIGHNKAISWGLTTSYVDVEDLYVEQIRGDRARVGNSWQPLTTRTEEIKVKGEDPHKITVRSSRHGPLLSDVDNQFDQVGRVTGGEPADTKGKISYAVALSWTALTPSDTMDAIFALDKASDFAQFRSAARKLHAPSQNLIYADRWGNIGYQLPGDVPIRGKGDGSVPAPGWNKAYDWQGMIDFSALPYSYNPPSGYIVAANQPVIDSDSYPYPLSAGESYGWRSQELVKRITATDKISPAIAESMFTDDEVGYADALLPALTDVTIRDSWVAQGQQVLRTWDRHGDADSAGAAFFNVLMTYLIRDTFDDQLPTSLQPSSGDRWYAVLARLMKHPKSVWWDDKHTARIETRDDILVKAMTDARKQITVLSGNDPSEWSWGRLHRITLKHQAFGEVTGISRLFNRGDLPAPGGPAVVDAMAFDDRQSYAVTNGPTMRMLIDWSDLDNSRWINQSGNSGHAYAQNYDDQLPLWATGRMLPFRFSRAAVHRAAENTLTLAPQ